MSNYVNCMSSGKWDKNRAINNNFIFKKIINFFISYYRRKISEIFTKNKVQGENILELGCGTGGDTFWLMRNFKFKRATLVDFSSKTLEQIRNIKGNLNIKLVNKDILNLHLKEKFDLVHSGFVVEHFYGKERENIIKNIQSL